MKVLFFLRRIGPYHHARFEAAARLMDLVAVETRATSEEYSWQFKADGRYKIEQFPLSNDRERGIRGPQLDQTIQSLLQKHKPDVIVNTGWADAEYNSIVIHASKAKIPLVVISDSTKGDLVRKFYLEWMKSLVVKAYSSALVAGTDSSDYILSLGFKRNAIFKPWDVVDNDRFRNSNRSSNTSFDQRKFLCIARFIEAKNIPRLLEAFAAYVNEGGKRRLALIGGGVLESRLNELIVSLRIENRVELHRFIQEEEIIRHLSESFALVLPSTSEPWGLVINESMASGLPVLASTKCGATVDLVKDNQNGVIFDPYNIPEITKALQRMDSVSETRWKEMGEESVRIIDNWGLKEFAEGLESACTYAMKSGQRRPFVLLHKFLSR